MRARMLFVAPLLAAVALGAIVAAGSASAQGAAPKPRDIVVVPSWKSVAFKAASRLVLFGYSDKACQEKLNLYREENA